VTHEGAKLIGSAQFRKGDAVLQHGSIQLKPEIELFQQVFGGEMVVPTLPLALPRSELIETVVQALGKAAQDCFEMELISQPLTESEWQAIRSWRIS